MQASRTTNSWRRTNFNEERKFFYQKIGRNLKKFIEIRKQLISGEELTSMKKGRLRLPRDSKKLKKLTEQYMITLNILKRENKQ